MAKTHITLIYDSVDNAVFVSQVAKPLQLKKAQYEETVLISCEAQPAVAVETLRRLSHAGVGGGKVYIVKRTRFWGTLSLWPLVWNVRKILKHYNSYEITARGPHAGWIALKAGATNLTIQARGLLAQE